MERSKIEIFKDKIKENKPFAIACVTFFLIVIIMLSIIAYSIWHDQQIVGEKTPEPNTDLIFMGSILDEDKIIKVDESESVWHPELTQKSLLEEMLPLGETYELINTVYSLRSAIAEKNKVSKITKVTIPKNASYLPAVKKGINELDYYSKIGDNLDFDLLHMDIEMYAWIVDYKLYSGKQITEKYVIMIFDKMMIQGKLYCEGDKKLGLEINRYHISE